MCCCKCLVEKHAQNLPTSFAAISKYPLEYRKAIFINLTPKQKVNVWTDRLGKVAGNIKLTKKQHVLLDKFIKDLSPAVYDKNIERGLSISDKTLKSIFGETLAGNIFASLSPIQVLKENQTRSIVFGIDGIHQKSAETSVIEDCECSTESDYCGLQDCEKPGWPPCWDSTTGCGTAWIYPCDGMCEW